MTPGEIQGALRKLGIDPMVSKTPNGKINVMLFAADADKLATFVRDGVITKAPRSIEDAFTESERRRIPDELQAAMDANPEAAFVMSCAEQWARTGSLSDLQLEALEKWSHHRG